MQVPARPRSPQSVPVPRLLTASWIDIFFQRSTVAQLPPTCGRKLMRHWSSLCAGSEDPDAADAAPHARAGGRALHREPHDLPYCPAHTARGHRGRPLRLGPRRTAHAVHSDFCCELITPSLFSCHSNLLLSFIYYSSRKHKNTLQCCMITCERRIVRSQDVIDAKRSPSQVSVFISVSPLLLRRFSLAANFVGLPAISLPVGHDSQGE